MGSNKAADIGNQPKALVTEVGTLMGFVQEKVRLNFKMGPLTREPLSKVNELVRVF